MTADNRHIPPPEIERLELGFMRLSDSAPLVLARARGLFERYGLEVTLRREVSWANLRDKLVAGRLDAAQLLAPLPMMTTCGAGGLRAELITGLSLSLNGNAITLSRALWDKLAIPCRRDALASAGALGSYIRRSPPGQSLTFATVHMFSMHTFQLRMWLRAGGINPDRDVRIIVLPPEQMGDSLAQGIIDGYCVGEPWNTVAVENGCGVVAAIGYDIWNNAPEKVLGVTSAWHDKHAATHLRLRLALMEACQALQSVDQRLAVAELLSHPDYLDLPEPLLTPSLSGRFALSAGLPPERVADFHVFGRYQAGFPWRSHAAWMVNSSCALLGKPMSGERCRSLVEQCYRTDLYREAVGVLALPVPDRDHKPEGRHDLSWSMGEVELGPDRMIDGDRFLSGT